MSVTMSIFWEAWHIAGTMSPYLLFGFAVAGVLSVALSPAFVERQLGGRGLAPVIKAALIGVPAPLCSCGVIPVATALRKRGASDGATVSFLASTPQTGVDSLMATYALLGLPFTIFRAVAAFVTGLVCGVAVDLLDKTSPAPVSAAPGPDAASAAGGKLHRAWRYAFLELPGDIGPALLIGLLISGLIGALVPENYFADKLGRAFDYPIMLALGIPMYVCSTASIPLAMTFIAAGVSPGAALVFLIVGPATNAATIAALWKSLGRRTAIVYLVSIGASALAAGALLDSLGISAKTAETVLCRHHETGGVAWLDHLSALVLLGLVANARYGATIRARLRRRIARANAANATMTVELIVTGMTCENCAAHVRDALTAAAPGSTARVTLKTGEVSVTGHDLSAEALVQAAERAGYRATTPSQT